MPRATRVSKSCLRCGASFSTTFVEQKFCSRSCAAKGPRPSRRRQAIPERTCGCGKVFRPPNARRRFCSRLCATQYGGRLVAKQCPQCQRDFQTKDTRKTYCSSRCAVEARRARNPRVCDECGSTFHDFDKRQRYCSRACAVAVASRRKREQTFNWRGGRTLTKPQGYVRVLAPDHPRAKPTNPYVLEHILVMEGVLGRYLEPNERVHHKNGQRQDNRPENLELWKMKDPPGVRSADYHCAGCNCDRMDARSIEESRGAWTRTPAA